MATRENARFERAVDLSGEAFDKVVQLEAQSYPADEGASAGTMTMRRTSAPDLFRVALTAQGEAVGFVNGTLTSAEQLTEATMSEHEPEGAMLCIHSVVVAPERRKQGLARAMLRRYLELVAASQEHVASVALLAKANLVPFYESCGFACMGPSPVKHGKDTWFELSLDLRRIALACVNAFSDVTTRFSGNPAAVCLVPFRTRSLGLDSAQGCGWVLDGVELEAAYEAWASRVAEQMNLSETAFLRDLGAAGEEAHRFELRWLTPSSEVLLCGHATLASAAALWSADAGLQRPGSADLGRVKKLVFESRSGELFAEREADGRIALTFPKETLEPLGDAAQRSALLVALGLAQDDPLVVHIAKNRMDIMVHLSSRDAVEALAPDLKALAAIQTRGVTVTAEARDGESYDFVSRFFGPGVGVDEDPFTGSAHCYLAPYWAGRLGKATLQAFQASKRGGMALLEVDEAASRVRLVGSSELSWTGAAHSTPFSRLAK